MVLQPVSDRIGPKRLAKLFNVLPLHPKATACPEPLSGNLYTEPAETIVRIAAVLVSEGKLAHLSLLMGWANVRNGSKTDDGQKVRFQLGRQQTACSEA
jgi:hypothetical protein